MHPGPLLKISICVFCLESMYRIIGLLLRISVVYIHFDYDQIVALQIPAFDQCSICVLCLTLTCYFSVLCLGSGLGLFMAVTFILLNWYCINYIFYLFICYIFVGYFSLVLLLCNSFWLMGCYLFFFFQHDFVVGSGAEICFRVCICKWNLMFYLREHLFLKGRYRCF